MGLKGKIIVTLEVKCGGHSIYDIFHTNTHHLPNIGPSRIKHFEIHEGEIGKIGSVVSWRYYEELYNSFTVITSCEHWTTITLVYEKKIEDTPEPLALLDYFIGMTKDVEGHLLKK
ncbi:hypothetical protein R3W88_010784 [Solanum pinnatisectum]|uniref:Bet v I/Major latex protein domain-containing protein n=1 Tax=Solanum pinnatisectum TaxID=50273 RepID=A0AAV9L4A9_9SOLN|nr:hypothetical protein R3W88_010784 [Solanum pinnatisectum]